MSHSTGKVIEKSMKLTQLFLNRKEVTVKDVMAYLGVTHSCAYKYVQIASTVLPIYSLNEGNRAGHEPIRYQLL